MQSFAVDCRLRRRKRDRNGAAVKENPRSKRKFSSGTARVKECSPEIFDFRANSIPHGKRVGFFDTL